MTDELRLSQLIMTFGPGAMVDLPTRSVIVSGLPLWRSQSRQKVIEEPRLQVMLERSLKANGRLAPDRHIQLRRPPVDDDPNGPSRQDLPVLVFPLWFVCEPESGEVEGGGSRRRMVRWCDLDWRSGKYAGDGKAVNVAPLRFVGACRKGHLQDIDWRRVVHRGTPCRNAMWLMDRARARTPRTSASCATAASESSSKLSSQRA